MRKTSSRYYGMIPQHRMSGWGTFGSRHGWAVNRARLVGTAGGGNQMHRSYVAGKTVMRSSRSPGTEGAL
jgi:hypothetical protein